MSAPADSRVVGVADGPSDDMPKRTQNYGAVRRSVGNTPVITGTSDNVCTVRLAESDSESHGESKRAAPSSTRIPLPTSSLRVICCYCPGWDRTDPANKGASHTICPTCSAKFNAELDQLEATA